MKRMLSLCLVLALGVATAVASSSSYSQTPPMPKVLAQGRYVYVRSYDGDQFSRNVLPEDRTAINAVQNELQRWGHYVVVYNPKEADVILIVQARPSEDSLAAYDAKQPYGNYLWRVSGENGLQKNETPLVKKFEQAVDKANQSSR